jgi:preprotein translocase subunit SecY
LLSRLQNMFRVADLRGKILFTLLIIAIYRLGAHIPVPYIDFDAVRDIEDTASAQGVAGFLNLFSGGALTNVAVFSLGIMPYITSSIIMQLLSVVIPKVEEWRNEGPSGQKKITQTTRYMTVALALMQSTAIVFSLNSGGGGQGGGIFGAVFQGVDVIPVFNTWRVIMIVLTLTAGTAFIMWLGELITQRGIGNGMSLLIFSGVVATLPAQGNAVWQERGAAWFFTILAMGIAMIVGVVFVESGQRRIPVQFAKRVVGRRMYGGQSTYIPLKVNQSGVIPVIFASSVLYFPVLAANVIPWDWLENFIDDNLVRQDTPFYIGAFTLLIVFFAYFYTAISFNPAQQADTIRRQGGFIPGYRPGRPTEEYLAKVLNRITLPGSLFLAFIALVPLLTFAIWDISQFAFGGTTLLITVGVALETMRQIDAQLMQRNYEGFLQ